MEQRTFEIKVLPYRLAIVRLDQSQALPEWVSESPFCSITRTTEELSIVCYEQCVPEGLVTSKSWCSFKIQGPLDLSDVGVLSSIANPLANAGIGVFVLSTYETDYFLVKEENLSNVIFLLSKEGHRMVP